MSFFNRYTLILSLEETINSYDISINTCTSKSLFKKAILILRRLILHLFLIAIVIIIYMIGYLTIDAKEF